ncbi:MAG: S46 family peptidase [Candidatus Aminicenantes bacterium]|nr:S46 family peptidase [Candidatus Aminicenantes bacterium]
MRYLKAKIFSLILVFSLFIPIHADEGMWLFNMPPSSLLKAKYNFNVTTEWLKHMQLASVRFGGASGSFVSPDGLVLTNHHVGQGAIQNLSTKDRDLMKTGFYARTRAEELKAAGLELMVLQEIEDVTTKVLGAEKSDMTAAQAAAAKDKVIAALEKESSEKTGLRSTVVNLYSGSMFHLYKYKVYTDARLVFAVEYAAAFFGGDPDNFTYPRYDLDISLFRIYENDKPMNSKHYLKWDTAGVKEGDLVFASGQPGSTGRLLTLAQMEFLRDVSYPYTISNYERRRALLKEFSSRGPEYARQAQGPLFGIENSLKATIGYQSGLLDKKLMEKKAKEEQALRGAVKKDPALDNEFSKAWDELADAQKKFASFFKAYRFFEGGAGFSTGYFNTARTLVRLAMEKGKPNDERLREYRDASLPSISRRMLAVTPIYDELEIFNLTDSLIQLQKEFGNYQEVKWLFAGKLAEDVAKDLVTGTKLGAVEVRKKYLDSELDAVYLSDDPMIKLALLVDPISRGLRKKYQTEVESVETRNGALIARALFKLKGTSIPPDATSTLRLSFGAVKTYMESGKKIPFATTFRGLYDKAAKFKNKPPYELSPSFIKNKAQLKLNTPLNFIATCDSIGGNSGSPVINRKGEFSGVLFDGNIQSLPARFVYSDQQNRSVMVHSRGIIEALLKIYNAKPLVDELLGKK